MLKFGFLCLFCLGWQYTTGSPVTVSEYEYVREADAWLRLHIVPATWSDAALLCQLEGGVLATPTNRAMTKAMLKTIAKHRISSEHIFIGVTDLFSKGYFRSLDGASLDVNLEWASGEPNNVGNTEDCLALSGAGATIDVSCARVLPYFCRKNTHNYTSTTAEVPTEITSTTAEDVTDSTSTTAEDVTDSTSTNDIASTPSTTTICHNGYEWEPSTNKCYKFHGAAKLWHRALAACSAEGGHLAIINSDTESTVLKNLYNKHADTITAAEQPKHAFIGFRKFDDGAWATIYGQTLDEAGFARWDHGEPSNGNGLVDENCGTIHRNGLLNDGDCSRTCPYICESPPSAVVQS